MVAVMKGWNVKVYLNGTEIGRAESVTLEIATGLDPYYELGSRVPAELVEGNEEITGTLSRAQIDNSLLNLVNPGGTLDNFTLYFKSQLTGGPYIYAYSCKAETWSQDWPQDDFVMNDLDFRAVSITYGTIS